MLKSKILLVIAIIILALIFLGAIVSLFIFYYRSKREDGSRRLPIIKQQSHNEYSGPLEWLANILETGKELSYILTYLMLVFCPFFIWHLGFTDTHAPTVRLQTLNLPWEIPLIVSVILVIIPMLKFTKKMRNQRRAAKKAERHIPVIARLFGFCHKMRKFIWTSTFIIWFLFFMLY